MAAPSSSKRFHLVLAHDLRDNASSRQSVFDFWRMRFPNALVTDIPFSEEDRNIPFVNRAQTLLLTIQKARDSEAYEVSPDDYLPYIFICHGLGGSLAKQALVLASQERKYGRYASDTALLVLCDTPEAGKDMTTWQLQVCRFLTVSNLGFYPATSLFNELPETLERLHWSFKTIQKHHSIRDFTSKSAESKLNMVTKPTIISRGGSTIDTVADETSLWGFTSGDRATEKIFDIVSRVVQQQTQPLSKQFHAFMRLLSRVDSNNYQLQFNRQFTGSMTPITAHNSFCNWRNLDFEAPNLLYLWTPQDIGSAAVASHLAGALGISSPDYIMISFSFNKHDLRTQSITTFYVSMIRQLLLSQRSLFRGISPFSEWTKGEHNLSYEVFRSLFLSLLKDASSVPIVCILHAVQDCVGFPLDHIVDLINEFRRLSSGIFKVMMLSSEPVGGAFANYPDVCCDIDLLSWSATIIESHVLSQIRMLAEKRPHWRGCENEVAQKLCRPSVTYTQASISMRLLHSENIPSTRSATLDAMKKLGFSEGEVYGAVIDHCESLCPFPLEPLLRWVLHSVRPLSMDELAVVIGLSYPVSSSIETLRLNTPLDIFNDLWHVKDILVEIIGHQVLPVYRAIIPALNEKWRVTDADGVMLCTCLRYLKMILINVPTVSPPPGVRITSRGEDNPVNPTADEIPRSSSHLIDDEETEVDHPPLVFDLSSMLGLEYGLLEYTVMNWPEHYKRAQNKEMVQSQIQDLFSSDHEVQAWYTLYQKFTGMNPQRVEKLDSLLNIACRFGLLEIVKDVIEQVKVSEKSSERLSKALDLAVCFGHKSIVSLLIKEGAESNEAPGLAAEYGFLEILQQLTKANPIMAKVEDKFGRSPFLLATLSGNENIAIYLLADGAEHTATKGDRIKSLRVAALTGQVDLLYKLVDAGSDVNTALDSRQSSALMLAATGGFDDIVRFLISHNARINDQDSHGETALHRAVEHGHASTCDLLFAAGADIHITAAQGFSPVHIASNNGYLGILKNLITSSKEQFANIKVKVQSKGGQANQTIVYDDSLGVRTPLELAVSNGHRNIMLELLNHPHYNFEINRAVALFIACKSGFPQLVEELLGMRITTIVTDIYGSNALHLATQEQYPDIVARLLDVGSGSGSIFDVNARNNSGCTPLHLAARSGCLITVQTLLKSGASLDIINSSGEAALHISSYHGHTGVVDRLMDYLNHNPTIERDVSRIQNSSNDTAFIIAVKQGHYKVASAFIKYTPLDPMKLQGQKNALIESASQDCEDLIKLLLDNKWDVNATNEHGETALHLATMENLISTMELLMSRDADCNSRDKNGHTPLHRATSKLAVQTLLIHGADINAADNANRTILFSASMGGRDEVVEALLDWAPQLDLNTRQSGTGLTPLHACSNNAKITEMLLKAGADPKALDEKGDPPFFRAAQLERGYEILQKFIDAGIDINTKNEDGKALIHVAAYHGSPETLEYLCENGADTLAAGNNGETALHLAAQIKRYKFVKYLLEQDFNLTADCKDLGTPLMAAAKGGGKAVELLLQKGAEVNAVSKSCATHNALQTATCRSHIRAIRTLLRAGADVNIRGGKFGSALCAAVATRNKDVVGLLLDKDENISYVGGPQGSALELALSNRSLKIVDMLLKRGADVNAISKGKYGTALIAAVHTGQTVAVEKLLELKADANLVPAGGESPVQIAIRKGRQNIVELLIKHGAKLDYLDKGGRGVLSHSISHQSFELLPYLLQNPSIDIDQQDSFGRTPLIHATKQGHHLIDDILARKAKVDVQDRRGTTALAYAVSRNYGLLVSKILAANADPLIQDIRGRDALYWATLHASESTFEQVLKKMEDYNASMSRYHHAVHAAIAANNLGFLRQLLEQLLEASFPFDNFADQDGWTAAYTALRYDHQRITSLITWAVNITGRPKRDPEIQPKPPTQWHPTDMSEHLARQPDNMSIKVERDAYFPGVDQEALARADHPMVPNKDGIYYFEVTVVNGGNGKRMYGIGFCEEGASLDKMLGWEGGTWGYHGDDGKLFGVGQTNRLYGPQYDEGSTVGCGVNFKKDTAFYTYNGEVIGRAFTDVRGKLYPAVSIDTRMTGCTLTARFWNMADEQANKSFMFQGPYDGRETLEPPERSMNKSDVERSINDDDSSGSLDEDYSD